jgi:hypothetical protein
MAGLMGFFDFSVKRLTKEGYLGQVISIQNLKIPHAHFTIKETVPQFLFVIVSGQRERCNLFISSSLRDCFDRFTPHNDIVTQSQRGTGDSLYSYRACRILPMVMISASLVPS